MIAHTREDWHDTCEVFVAVVGRGKTSRRVGEGGRPRKCKETVKQIAF